MALNVSEISTSMRNAALGALKEKGPEIKGYAETEFKKLAETLAMIEKMRLTGAMTEEQAQLHLQIQKNATRTVLLTVEGLGMLAVEQAINAALAVVKDAVNSALKFTLL